MPLKREMIDVSDPRVTLIGHPAPAWMVNYADLMTELVCFFLIMYALGSSLSKPIQAAKQEIEETMKKQEVSGNVTINKDGLVISLQEQGYNVFFESGSSELTDHMKNILDQLAPTFNELGAKNHDMIVEGHTDDVPIKTPRFASNWELSSGRATNVVQYLVNKHGYPAAHIAATGYGSFRSLPRAPDEDLTGWRARNRRVVFVVKNPDNPLGKGDKVAEVSDKSTPAAAGDAPVKEAVEPAKAKE